MDIGVDRAAARRLAVDCRRQPTFDPSHGLVAPRYDPVALALHWADLQWTDVYGWPLEDSRSSEHEAWRELVHAEALALQQGWRP